MWSKWEVPEWKRECFWEARKFSKPLQIHLEFSMFMRVFKRGGVLPTGRATVSYLAFPPGACFHPGIFRSQLLFRCIFLLLRVFSTLAVFLGVASDIILNDPATEASGSNRIMIALTLLLHALDETLAEVNASLASGDGLTLRAIPGMVGESLIPTLVAQSQVGLLCSAALETAMMDGPAFRVGD
ncbi:hypothetical protein PAPYR_7602 [Paratrimastix pyriformis]|uniref:Uncharacterized protein n=1 Tax=Paratrimastix pyriformis TaxID=342808 RepID=A0ABQ8UCT0_9EUKA|nr:hypothetical protein PAPYR_12588 [Paratrimastix pyriformis]KAJ4457092.1 hypothetical protein PAPYR_7602 [Paratrimastix pyriformis]